MALPNLLPKFSFRVAPKARASPHPARGLFPYTTHLSRKQGVGVKLLHLGHQIICGEGQVLHKLPVQQEPIGASIHSNALRDSPVPQAPHVGVTLQEEPVQTLLSDEPGKDRVTLQPKGAQNPNEIAQSAIKSMYWAFVSNLYCMPGIEPGRGSV